jgi:hypothetical protein
MHQQTGSLEVGEELVPEPGTVRRTLDETGHVGDGELPCVRSVDHAEHRLERRERILRDLRLRVGDAPEQRRLARVRQAGERRVDHELQTQLEVQLVSRQSRLREARRLPGRRREARVASTTLPSARGDEAAVSGCEVGDEPLVGVVDLSPDWHADLRVVAVRAVLLAPAAIPASPGRDASDATEPGKVSQARIDAYDDVAAAPSVTAVRAALGDVLLAAEAQAAVAATPRFDVDLRSVVKHRSDRRGRGKPRPYYSTAAETEMKRFSPERRNSTVPSRSAKIVSSRPRPAPGPGRNFVPR